MKIEFEKKRIENLVSSPCSNETEIALIFVFSQLETLRLKITNLWSLI